MERAHEENINTPKYWDEYHIPGRGFRSNTRRIGESRYLEVLDYIDKDSIILEVGCNFGDFLKYMLENKIKFCTYSGLDFSPIAIEKAIEEHPENIWITSDCQETLLNDKYNCIISMQTLEHIEKPKIVLEKMYNALKEGGKVVITVPDGMNTIHKSHVWYINKEDLEKMLYSVGFVDIEIKSINDDRDLLVVAKKMKKITVVTPVLCPSKEVFATIKKCFVSIRKAVDKVNGEWIIVDDNSAEGREFFSDIADVYIRNAKTTGVSTSLNRGMKIGKGSFLVKLDSDYFVPENLFEILLNDWSDDLAFISPSYTFGKPHVPRHFDIEEIPEPEGGVVDRPPGMSSTSLYHWGGGILMFDAEKIKEIDYFDDDFDIGSAQDNDVIYRILMKGHNWRWSKNVLTRHFASISSNDPNAPDTRRLRRKVGNEFFLKKHGFAPGGFISKIYRHFKYEEKK